MASGVNGIIGRVVVFDGRSGVYEQYDNIGGEWQAGRAVGDL